MSSVVPVLAGFANGVAAAGMLAAWFWCAWRIVLVALPAPGASLRACAVATTGLVLGAAVFAGLVATSEALGVRAFRIETALATWVAIAAGLELGLRRRTSAARAVEALAAELAECRRKLGSLVASRAALVALPVLALLAASWLRASVAPPLAWDALTYHLVKAARWTQGSGLYLEDAPDAWGYYRWFAWLGDSVWSWALLATHDDLLLGTANALVAAWIVVAMRACAKELGADELVTWLAAAAVALVPAVQRFWSACYVENLLLACWISGVAFLVRAARARDPGAAWLAASAFAACAGIKLQGLPLGVLGLVAIAFVVARGGIVRGRALAWTCAAIASACVGLAHYGIVAAGTGSPFHPHAVPGFGAGDEELAEVLRGSGTLDVGAFLDALFGAHARHAGFGPAGALVVLAGIAGASVAPRPSRSARARSLVVLLVASSALVVLPMLAPEVAALRERWGPVSARFAAPAFAAAVIGLLALPRRATIAVLALALAQDVVLGLPIRRPSGWIDADVAAIGRFVLVALPLLAVAAWIVTRERARAISFAASLLLAAVATVPWERVRADHRAVAYRAARNGAAFDVHAFNAEAEPIWSALEREPGLRIAVTAGWDPPGHGAFLYPLFGARLQHTVEYVPVARDGSVVDHRRADELASKADERAWIERLVARAIDVVVVLRPLTGPEPAWIGARPELFEPFVAARQSRAWRFRIDAARAWLASSR